MKAAEQQEDIVAQVIPEYGGQSRSLVPCLEDAEVAEADADVVLCDFMQTLMLGLIFY